MPTIIEGSGHRRKLEILGGVRCYLQKKQQACRLQAGDFETVTRSLQTQPPVFEHSPSAWFPSSIHRYKTRLTFHPFDPIPDLWKFV
jgi:hypothetical protein